MRPTIAKNLLMIERARIGDEDVRFLEMGTSDLTVRRCVERARLEFYKEWFGYIAEDGDPAPM